MDSTIRLITKATTWQIMGFFTMMLVGYIITGSIAAGGGIALAGAVTGFMGYFIHELIWSRIAWGRAVVHGMHEDNLPASRSGASHRAGS